LVLGLVQITIRYSHNKSLQVEMGRYDGFSRVAAISPGLDRIRKRGELRRILGPDVKLSWNITTQQKGHISKRKAPDMTGRKNQGQQEQS